MRHRFLMAVALVATLSFSLPAADKAAKPDKKAPAPTAVDSGTFTISVAGRRVASETFHVDQRQDGSTITSELKFSDANVQALQSAEMTIRPDGLLKKYTWKEVTPGSAQIVVEPQDEQFMVARVSETSSANPKDTVHPLAPETSIMDDNFFSHMEVLTWKYMAFGCKLNAQQQTVCNWRPLRMPVFVPHQQQSLIVEVSYLGVQKARSADGKEIEFKTFNFVPEDPYNFKAEGGNYLLWLDAQNKLVKVVVAANNIEVLRD
jgi:hypothetical protein